MRVGRPLRDASAGFAFVAVLALLAIVSIGLAAAGSAWSQQARREHERELLRIGGLYAQAIADYRDNSPGSVKHYPASLADLLIDNRSVRIRRYLRRLYADPTAPDLPWGLVKTANGEVEGVYSQNEATPLATAPQVAGPLILKAAARYADWQFVAPEPPAVTAPTHLEASHATTPY
jgi:type II secretory pathway pseudopilin PulG